MHRLGLSRKESQGPAILRNDRALQTVTDACGKMADPLVTLLFLIAMNRS